MGQGGAALVRLSSLDDATRAVQALQGHRVLGALHPLIIRFADSAEIKAKKQARQLTTTAAGLVRPGTAAPISNPAVAAAALSRYNPYTSLAASSSTAPPFPALASPSSFAAPQLSTAAYYAGVGMSGIGIAPPPLSLPMASSQADPALYMSPDYPLARSAQMVGSAITLPGEARWGVSPGGDACGIWQRECSR